MVQTAGLFKLTELMGLLNTVTVEVVEDAYNAGMLSMVFR
jgi:hypothetical protein